MKFNKWTLGLAAVGVVSLASAARADETNMVMTALSTTTISGYVDTSASYASQSAGYNNPNYYYNSPANAINLNVVDIALDHPLDSTPWAAGYHAEMWFGPNASALGTSATDGGSAAIRQAYITMMTPVGNGITWKVGVFDTIVGYESTTTGNNPNFTHSYGYNMEPTTHTGILGSYTINSLVSVEAGIADTSYASQGTYTANVNDTLYRPTWLGGLTLTAPDSFGWAKGATFTFATVINSGNTTGYTGTHGSSGQTYYGGISLPTPIAALKFGAAFDYLNAVDGYPVGLDAPGGGEHAWDAGIYATYQLNDKASINLRAEYYNGADLNSAGAYSQDPGLQQGAQQAQEITATLQYALWANVLTRLEVRADNVNHGNGYTSNAGNNYAYTFLLAAQAVYTF